MMPGFLYSLSAKNYYFNTWGNECKIEHRKSFRDCNSSYEKLHHKGSNYTHVCSILDPTRPRTYEIGAKHDISKFTSKQVKTSWHIVYMIDFYAVLVHNVHLWRFNEYFKRFRTSIFTLSVLRNWMRDF